MPIDIHINEIITSCSHSPEYSAALKIEKELVDIAGKNPEISGDIYIIANQSLFFQKRNDLDLIIIGLLEGMTVSGPFKVKTNSNKIKDIDKLVLKSFVTTIELKSHDQSKIQMRGNHYFVQYKSNWHDTSKQSSEAKFSFVEFAKSRKWFSQSSGPFTCDILWFENITDEDLNGLRGGSLDNAIAGDFDISKFTQALVANAKVEEDNNEYKVNFISKDGAKAMIDFFNRPRTLGGLTLKKFNLLSALLLKDATKPSTDNLTVAKGRAGTGKTLWLLQKAIEHSSHERSNPSCLLLTYNKSLVYDLKRIIDGFGEATPCPEIMSVHSYLMRLMKDAGMDLKAIHTSEDNYDRVFCEKTNELKRLCGEHLRNYDYVFIDESQDLSACEKEIFVKVFGCDRIFAADGVDQFVRNTRPAPWKKVSPDKIEHIKFNISKRQKSGLVSFVNAIAQEYGLEWKIKPDSQLKGGKVRIYDSYTSTIHNDLLKEARKNECEDYDIMILVPPCMVETNPKSKRRFFSKIEAFRNCRINVFDGTDRDSREEIPLINASRIFPYHSCRGLEGWSVVCYMLDAIYESILSVTTPSNSYCGLDPKVDHRRQAILWLLMPLTRPIDTLIITLQNPSSEFGKMLRKLAYSNPDTVEWNCRSCD